MRKGYCIAGSGGWRGRKEIKKAEHRRLPGTTGVNENPAFILKIIQNQLFSTGFDKENSKNLGFSRKRLHQQINPVVRDGVVRKEYADLLANKEYTPERLEEWGRKAEEWILRQGGVTQAAQKFLEDLGSGRKTRCQSRAENDHQQRRFCQ